MITPGELKKGLTLELDGQLWSVMDYQHIKMGRGGALVRVKVRNLRSGHTVERTFPASEKFRRVFLERRQVQFLYRDAEGFHFMDSDNFEQMRLSEEHIGDDANYLTEGLALELLTYGEEPMGVELPLSVELRVAETEPWVKGDSATSGNKPAVLETGLKVLVPLFVEVGDTIRVDTRTGHYLERVS